MAVICNDFFNISVNLVFQNLKMAEFQGFYPVFALVNPANGYLVVSLIIDSMESENQALKSIQMGYSDGLKDEPGLVSVFRYKITYFVSVS